MAGEFIYLKRKSRRGNLYKIYDGVVSTKNVTGDIRMAEKVFYFLEKQYGTKLDLDWLTL